MVQTETQDPQAILLKKRACDLIKRRRMGLLELSHDTTSKPMPEEDDDQPDVTARRVKQTVN